MDINEIKENFSLIEDWEDKYEYLISLGKKLPPMPEELHIEQNRLNGCISNVWIVLNTDDSGKVTMQADGDAQIVKGLLAIIYAIVSSGEGAEIRSLFAELGLSEQLTPNRRNGLYSAIEHVEKFFKANI